MVQKKRCSYCRSEEGKIRMVGKFEVVLTEVKVGESVKHACQSCKVKVKEAREALRNAGF